MDKTELIILRDNVIGVNYSLEIVESAKDLSDELKAVLKRNDIDYTQYNSYTANPFNKDNTDKNPPKEIYEYQNFFILERTNGDIVLLDGFRRLLWYDAPSTPILVRFYKEADLTDQQMLTLLVNLNHFKFFSDQAYHERGFSLLLKTVFNINITNIKNSFDAYLSSKETKNSYSSFGELHKQSKNEEIKNRIVNKFFTSDLRFLQTLQEEHFLCDQYMGALLYEMRTKSNKDFDVNTFISLIRENSILVELMEKYKKVGTDHSAKSQDIVNKIMEMYRNIFTIMEGGEKVKSFAEKQREAKDLVDKLKKDKILIKLTGNSKTNEIERRMDKMISNGEKLEFICVIHPNETRGSFSWDKGKKVYELPYGLFEGLSFLEYTSKRLGFGAKEINIGLLLDDNNKATVTHNYGDMSSYGKKYTKLSMPYGSQTYEIDLFVRMEVEKKAKSTEPRKLKEFVYHEQGFSSKRELCILAWTQKEARELLQSIGHRLTDSDMRNYVGQAWGNNNIEILKDQDLSQSCIYAISESEKVEKLK